MVSSARSSERVGCGAGGKRTVLAGPGLQDLDDERSLRVGAGGGRRTGDVAMPRLFSVMEALQDMFYNICVRLKNSRAMKRQMTTPRNARARPLRKAPRGKL